MGNPKQVMLWDLTSESAENAPDADYLVKCNHCGWVKRHSLLASCPKNHVAGFSYVGPIEAQEKSAQ